MTTEKVQIINRSRSTISGTKKILFTVVLAVTVFFAKAQRTPNTNAVMVYGFRNFNIVLIGPSVSDSLFSQSNTQAVSKARTVFMSTGVFRMLITNNKQPFQQPVNNIEIDPASDLTIDDLDMRSGIMEVGKYTEWKDVKSLRLLNLDTANVTFPITPANLPLTKGDYHVIFSYSTGTYTTRVFSIRNKKTQEEIAHFRLRVLDEPVVPFLKLVATNNSDKKLIDSFLIESSSKIELPDLSQFTQGDRSTIARRAPDNPTILSNEPFHKTSELVLYFKKQNGDYPDSSLQYRLLSESKNDTNWLKTGHRLVISHLVPDDHYKLQIRYELHPGHIQDHTFYVVPEWYQTTFTKIAGPALVILAALLTWLLVYRQRLNKNSRRREQLSLEIKSIRSQLNPHFVFNALSSIQGLINKNDIPAANRYLTEFSMLLRESLHNDEKEMLPLVTEISLLETYLKLEQLRFNFKYTIHTDQAIDKNGVEIPNLILQPLVENAVKHGVASLGDKGLIKIDFAKSENDLLVSITDNGKNYDGGQSVDGFGLRLTRSRITLLNETLKEQPVQLTIGRREDMETIVLLKFTNWL